MKKITIEELYQTFLAYPIITTDTRNCPKGSLFFALKGDTFNGNNFALEALQKGCSYAIIDDNNIYLQNPSKMILVDDVLETLQQLAHYHRKKMQTPILQITGTNGKTTTKELIASVLQKKGKILYTRGNLNNHIGVPLTLLQLQKEHIFAVIETGANHLGEIKTLSEIVDANYGLITNVGKAHLEGFGNFEGVVQTKKELYTYLLKKKAKIFLNTSDPLLTSMATGLDFIGYGKENNNVNLVSGKEDKTDVFVTINWQTKNDSHIWNLKTKLIGSYNLPNILAAIAVGIYFEIEPELINQALSDYLPQNNRSEYLTIGNNQLIVDAYNANPSSMEVALLNFQTIIHTHKLIILGEMKELGENSIEEHQRIISLAQKIENSELWLVGNNFKEITPPNAFWFENVEKVKNYLQNKPLQKRFILIKGSNGVKLFQLKDFLSKIGNNI